MNLGAVVWRGSDVATDRQGVKILGTPVGHPDFVSRHLRGVLDDHRTLLNRIPHVQDFCRVRG